MLSWTEMGCACLSTVRLSEADDSERQSPCYFARSRLPSRKKGGFNPLINCVDWGHPKAA